LSNVLVPALGLTFQSFSEVSLSDASITRWPLCQEENELRLSSAGS
jgi:hypothetical protein